VAHSCERCGVVKRSKKCWVKKMLFQTFNDFLGQPRAHEYFIIKIRMYRQISNCVCACVAQVRT